MALEGHIQTGSYDNKDGQKVYTTDVIVDRFEFVGGGKGNNQGQAPANNQGNFNQDITPVYDGDAPF